MWCCKKQHVRKIYPVKSYNCYLNPENKNYKVLRFVKFQQSRNPYEYENSSRMKIKSKNLQDIYADLRNSRSNFIDDDFNHVYYNISRDQNENSQIQWRRVVNIVKNPVYSLVNKNYTGIQNFKSNNKALQVSLSLISRTHPKKLQQLRDNKIKQEGVYQFKLFKNGIIYNVVIDDYVPTFKGYPIFTGPINEVEIYPMLLEKAIAKICQGYSQMPRNPIEIMEMIYCGAIIRQNLNDLSNLQQFKQFVIKNLTKKGLTILMAKNDKKIRQYGINTSEIYQILNFYEISYQYQTHTLYQIVSQNKLSSWNGYFRVTDPLWKQIDQQIKDKIYQNIKNNHSFVILDKQVNRVFQNLIIFQDTQRSNKDWLEYYSKNGSPSFCSFKIKQKDSVFIKILTRQKIRQYLIVCRVIKDKEFQYINGRFSEDCQFLQCQLDLPAGQYVICVIHDWLLKKQGQFVIYLSSTTRAVLVSQGSHFPNFLEQVFIRDSQLSNKDIIPIYHKTLKQIGIGYLRVSVKAPKKINKIDINFKKIYQQDWQVIQPYNDMKQIVTTSSIIIILKLLKNKPKSVINFPIQAFNIS